MNLEKPVLPSAACALLTTALVALVATLYWTVGPGMLPVTISDIWIFVWDQGFVRPHSCYGIDLGCRLSNLNMLFEDQEIRWHISLVVASALIGGLVTLISSMRHAPFRETIHTIRGNRLLYDADARFSFRQYLRNTGKAEDNSLWLTPWVQLTKIAEAYNLGVIGSHGSGKTGVLRGWIEQILKRNVLAIIHDAKGDVTEGLPQNEFILVAARDDRGWVWAIGRDITDPNAADELAAKFIPSETTSESIWSDSSRSILSALIESLQKERGVNWGWEELYERVFQSPMQIHSCLVGIESPVADLIQLDNHGGLSRTSQSILITMWIAALKSIRPIVNISKDVPEDRRFSISEWMSPNSTLPKAIILQHAADYPLLSTALSAVLIEIVAGKILAPSSPNRSTAWLHLILDELPVLRRLERLPELLNVGREKGVRCIAATQDWEQIEKIYGPEDAKTLEARLRIKIVCQLGISATRDRVVEHFGGERTIVEWDYAGENNPKTRRQSQVPVIEHHQLSDELGVIQIGNQTNVRVLIFGLGTPGIVNIPFTAWPSQRPAHVPLTQLSSIRKSTAS